MSIHIENPFGIRLYRIIATIALILFCCKEFHSYSGIPLIGFLLIVLLEISLLLIRPKWWNLLRYILATVPILIFAILMRYTFDIQASMLLWPLVWILGTLEKKYDCLAIVLVSSTIAAVLLMSLPSGFTITTLLALVGIFLGIRSIRIRREAYQTSQQHLQELNEAHQELKDAHEKLLEASVHSMRYAALEERTRLAREIHDGIGHQLTSLIVQLQVLELMLPNEPNKATELVSQLLPIARRTMAEVRIAVKEWTDDEMGLGLIALRGLVSQIQAQSATRFHFSEDTEISEWSAETSIVLYRVLQETLTNILRHANAGSVEIHLNEADNEITLSVKDDGQYAGDAPMQTGFGMNGIMERCRELGGSCRFIPQQPHGLCVEVVLPSEPVLDETQKEQERKC